MLSSTFSHINPATAAAAKSLQSCPTLCDPRDGSPPGSPVPGILQARTLEWVAISFSNAWKWEVKVKLLSHVRLQRPHGLQPTRLLHPWDFPGKSTGVGCHQPCKIYLLFSLLKGKEIESQWSLIIFVYVHISSCRYETPTVSLAPCFLYSASSWKSPIQMFHWNVTDNYPLLCFITQTDSFSISNWNLFCFYSDSRIPEVFLPHILNNFIVFKPKEHFFWVAMKVKVKLLSGVQLFVTLWLYPSRLLHPWDFPGKNARVGASSFSRGSSWPRDWTQVSHIAGSLFTVWATRES